tara:strand:+ start:763 stop:1122 length:360 start_codon:yes stop_codon:yes gene_type:complete
MSNEKFTKGDWFTDKGDTMDSSHLITTNYRSVENNMIPICEVETEFDGTVGVEQKANAQLIAQAPAMYYELNEQLIIINSQIEALTETKNLNRATKNRFHLLKIKQERISNLLAKARGE